MNETRQFTPGPWNSTRLGRFATIAAEAGGHHICSCDAAYSGARNASNARLIAAAPDLLAALESAVEAEKWNGSRSEFPAWAIRARAAIARAKGEKP